MKEVKVLQVFGSLGMGGAESRMMDVFRHIDRDSVQFDFVTLSSESQHFEQEIRMLGGRIRRIPSPRECGVLKHIALLRKCMRRGPYDVVHAHTSFHSGLVMLAGWLEHIPVRITHARTSGSKRDGIITKVFLLIGRLLILLFSTDRLAISNDAGLFLFGRKDYCVIPNAIDFEKYQGVTRTDIERIKNNLSITDDCFVVGQIGRFEVIKNHDFTIKWFAHYLKKRDNAFLVLIGAGPLMLNIQGKVREAGISEKVIFMGIRNDVNVLMHLFDVLFFPSLYEGLGGVAIEAQAAGVPCVVSKQIPDEIDLGLGLIKRRSLNSSLEKWDEAVDQCSEISVPNEEVRRKHFVTTGYDINEAVNNYLKIYRRFKCDL